MTREEKKRLYAPKRWALYENGNFIDIFESHRAAKDAKYFKTKEAHKDMLDLEYTIKMRG